MKTTQPAQLTKFGRNVLIATAVLVIAFLAAAIYARLSYHAHVNQLLEKHAEKIEERLKTPRR